MPLAGAALAWLARAFWGVFAAALPSLVGRLLLALGITFVSYAGLTVAINYAENYIKAKMNGLPSALVQFLAFLWVDKELTMIFSAVAAALVIKGVSSTGASFAQMRFKLPSA